MRLKWAVEFADFKPAGLVDKLPDNCKPATVVNPLSIDLTDSRYAGLVTIVLHFKQRMLLCLLPGGATEANFPQAGGGVASYSERVKEFHHHANLLLLLLILSQA
ncbi:hypothetical protein T4E_7422 [Trichinella pseudospiralis]|uniref:Uncharacterized protein n=1 Tax=Trichinella pseudospiralis TaxID=6337 RepID=A0A0V0XKH5_TRIPS|nr:hypothetical protein T4E_7422 [Trichinella pseudospiralis]